MTRGVQARRSPPSPAALSRRFSPWNRQRESATAAFGLEKSALKPLLLLYLLDRLAFHAATDSEDLSLQQTLSATVNLLVLQ
jgi:hypothetical protein